ncbi:MAG TPA: hypothetical protein VF665_15090 [Longimicrobium sp.]|jgi:hypothetical protein|uniref:hypothetical protein n=1 Tax=Longimicrobium sp. TaxID=2029185 RepID=UPI002ED8926B
MGDYTSAVALRYLALLVLMIATNRWDIADRRDEALSIAVVVFWIVMVQTEPAARHSLRAPSPWYGWMAVHAALIHALCVTAVMVAGTLLEPEPVSPYDPTGMALSMGDDWRSGPSVAEMAVPLLFYTAVCAGWAVTVGAVSRRVWGVLPPERHLVRIRRGRPTNRSATD